MPLSRPTSSAGGTEAVDDLFATRDALAKHPAAFPELLATSAGTGAGISELRAAVARLLAEQRA